MSTRNEDEPPLLKKVRTDDYKGSSRYVEMDATVGETPEKPRGESSSAAIVYCDHPEVARMNIFRVADFRFEKDPAIFVSHSFVGKNDEKRIPKPVKNPLQAFRQYEKMRGILRQKKVVKLSRMESQAWPVILGGDDVMCIGDCIPEKHTFLLPAIIHAEQHRTSSGTHQPTVLYLTPTPEIAEEIKKEADKMVYNNIKCVYFGKVDKTENAEISDMVSSTPEDIIKKNVLGAVKLDAVSYIVLHQADKILQTPSFKEQVLQILSSVCKNRQIVTTSTSGSENVLEFAKSSMVNPVQVKVKALDRTVFELCKLNYEVFKSAEMKFNWLRERLSRTGDDDKIVISCTEDETIYKIIVLFNEAGNEISYSELCADEKEKHKKVLDDFKTNQDRVLIGINVNTRGLDFTREIILYEFPTLFEDYMELMSLQNNDTGAGVESITITTLLDAGDWKNIPELITVLRKSKQDVPPELYDLANRFAKPTYSEFGRFNDIVGKDCFVDKSMMIKEVIERAETMLITAPRKFGKTSNLDMLKQFFDVAGEEDLFGNLKISEYDDIMKTHYRRYPILWIDMSDFSGVIDSVSACTAALRTITHKAYLRNEFLCDALKDDDRNICRQWCHDETYLKIDEKNVPTGLTRLAEYLRAYYNKPVVLLCDEFDKICDRAIRNVVNTENDKEMDAIIDKYFDAFTPLIKTHSAGSALVYKAVFTGVTAVASKGLSSLNNTPSAHFLMAESNHFVEYYGILLSEFEALLENPLFEKLRDEKEDAISFYEGYKCLEKQLLCTYSAIRYLSNVSLLKENRLISYWTPTGSFDEWSGIWLRENLGNLLQNLVDGFVFAVKSLRKIKAQELIRMHDMLKSEDVGVDQMDVLFIYMQQLGYFTIVADDGVNMTLQIPNEELRKEFSQLILAKISGKYNVLTTRMQECARHFDRLINIYNDGDVMKSALECLKKEVSLLCKGIKEPENVALNEATVQHLLYAVLLSSSYKPFAELKIETHDRVCDRRRLKRLDLCFYRRDFGVVIEVKFGDYEGVNAAAALQQIKNKKYCDIFRNNTISKAKDFKRILGIGMHVNGAGECEIKSELWSYAENQ